MTQYPEALLARELELCYANISLITDYDVGVEGVPHVTHAGVVRVFNANNESMRDFLVLACRTTEHREAARLVVLCDPGSPSRARLRVRDGPRTRPLRGVVTGIHSRV